MNHAAEAVSDAQSAGISATAITGGIEVPDSNDRASSVFEIRELKPAQKELLLHLYRNLGGIRRSQVASVVSAVGLYLPPSHPLSVYFDLSNRDYLVARQHLLSTPASPRGHRESPGPVDDTSLLPPDRWLDLMRTLWKDAGYPDLRAPMHLLEQNTAPSQQTPMSDGVSERLLSTSEQSCAPKHNYGMRRPLAAAHFSSSSSLAGVCPVPEGEPLDPSGCGDGELWSGDENDYATIFPANGTTAAGMSQQLPLSPRHHSSEKPTGSAGWCLTPTCNFQEASDAPSNTLLNHARSSTAEVSLHVLFMKCGARLPSRHASDDSCTDVHLELTIGSWDWTVRNYAQERKLPPQPILDDVIETILNLQNGNPSASIALETFQDVIGQQLQNANDDVLHGCFTDDPLKRPRFMVEAEHQRPPTWAMVLAALEPAALVPFVDVYTIAYLRSVCMVQNTLRYLVDDLTHRVGDTQQHLALPTAPRIPPHEVIADWNNALEATRAESVNAGPGCQRQGRGSCTPAHNTVPNGASTSSTRVTFPRNQEELHWREAPDSELAPRLSTPPPLRQELLNRCDDILRSDLWSKLENPHYMAKCREPDDISASVVARAKARKLIAELRRNAIPINRYGWYVRAEHEGEPQPLNFLQGLHQHDDDSSVLDSDALSSMEAMLTTHDPRRGAGVTAALPSPSLSAGQFKLGGIFGGPVSTKAHAATFDRLSKSSCDFRMYSVYRGRKPPMATSSPRSHTEPAGRPASYRPTDLCNDRQSHVRSHVPNLREAGKGSAMQSHLLLTPCAHRSRPKRRWQKRLPTSRLSGWPTSSRAESKHAPRGVPSGDANAAPPHMTFQVTLTTDNRVTRVTSAPPVFLNPTPTPAILPAPLPPRGTHPTTKVPANRAQKLAKDYVNRYISSSSSSSCCSVAVVVEGKDHRPLYERRMQEIHSPPQNTSAAAPRPILQLDQVEPPITDTISQSPSRAPFLADTSQHGKGEVVRLPTTEAEQEGRAALPPHTVRRGSSIRNSLSKVVANGAGDAILEIPTPSDDVLYSSSDEEDAVFHETTYYNRPTSGSTSMRNVKEVRPSDSRSGGSSSIGEPRRPKVTPPSSGSRPPPPTRFSLQMNSLSSSQHRLVLGSPTNRVGYGSGTVRRGSVSSSLNLSSGRPPRSPAADRCRPAQKMR